MESISKFYKEAVLALLYRLVIGGDRLLSSDTIAGMAMEQRIEKAKVMLLHSDATDFTNIRHFSRIFKTLTNRTPSEYREGKQTN